MADKKVPPPAAAFISPTARERRRNQRLEVQLCVVLTTPNGKTALLSDDVNRSGLFIRTDNPAPLRALVTIVVDLDDGHESLDTVAIVRHVVSPDQAVELGRSPGMGVQFYGMGPALHQRWDKLIHELAADPTRAIMQDGPDGEMKAQVGAYHAKPEDPDPRADSIIPFAVAPATGVRLAPEDVTDQTRRKYVRYPAEFKVRIPTVEKLEDFLTRDISVGGIFLATEREIKKGAQVRLVVVHPKTGEEFPIVGQVARVAPKSESSPQGLGVRFIDMTDERKAEFEKFVMSGLANLEVPFDPWEVQAPES
jgi:uncharacterized protein (TIGR02266 family)